MKVIILDRDGVINKDSDNYIKSPKEWNPICGSLEAISRLNKAGYTIAIATNQSGISRKYYSVETLEAIHRKMKSALKSIGGLIDYIEYCPHGPHDNCTCRKPLPGMLAMIGKHFKIKLKNKTMVGDSISDFEAATSAGMNFVLVRTGKGLRTLSSGKLPNYVPVFDNLSDYVDSILN